MRVPLSCSRQRALHRAVSISRSGAAVDCLPWSGVAG